MQRSTPPAAGSRAWTKVTWILLPALAFIGLLAFATTRTARAPEPGDPAPGFTAPLLAGDGSVALQDLRGRPVFLNFWASWCIPCRDEAGIIRRAHESYGDEIHFVGVDIRDARSDALAFADRYGLDHTLVRDEDLDIYWDYGLTGQPESFFIDRDGVVVQHVNGPLTEETLFQYLDVLVRRGA